MPTSDSPSSSFLSATESAAGNTSPDQKHSFWIQEDIEAFRWDQVYPYQLLVVRRGQDGYTPENNWEFTLPFPPQSMSYSMGFGVAGHVTQGGYIEEHSGAPVRNISFSGTLGVLPLRGTAPTRSSANFGESIFGGTIEQTNRTAVAAQSLASNFTGENPAFQENLVSKFEFADGQLGTIGKTSGYYQMRLLKNFFENYLHAKLKAENKDLRLALCLFKQQSVYLVTPTGAFNITQSAESPLEYLYSLSFKAWRRITLSSGNANSANQYKPAPRVQGAMQRALKIIMDARDVLENARDILGAVAGDIDEAVFTPLRETSLFIKDLSGMHLAYTDLPKHVAKDAKASIVQFVALREQLDVKPEASSRTSGDTFVDPTVHQDAVDGLKRQGARLHATKRRPQNKEIDVSDPSVNVLDDYNFLKNVKPGETNLDPVTIDAIQRERERVRALTRRDFEDMMAKAAKLAADFADSVGAGNAVFNATYQRPAITVSKTPSSQDYKVLFALNKFVAQLGKLAATTETQVKRLSSVDYVAGLARRSGLAFKTPRSKFLVPFPYGYTMEQLSQQYLKDPDRWIEIAALNGLRAPYIDETGSRTPLLTTGSGNEVVVADVSGLYIGQQVWLIASNTAKSMRRVTKIISNSETMHTVIVDGDADCERFTVAGEAVLHSFLPDTVNSQMTLYIPSQDEPVSLDYQAKEVPGLTVYDQFLNSAGFDLLLTANNDLALTPDGDCLLAVGLQNLIQEIRLRLSIPRGSLNRHPEFGLPVQVGQSVADMSAKDIAKALKTMFADDPAFTGVTAVKVLVKGPVTSISMAVTVKGQTQPIPLTLDVRR